MKIDWRLKQFTQKILSIIPFGENINFFFQQRFNNILAKKYGERVKYAINHFKVLKNEKFEFNKSQIIEIGTGWVPVDPFVLYFLDTKRIITVDHVKHMRKKLAVKVVNTIKEQFPLITSNFNVSIKDLEDKYEKLVLNSTLKRLLDSANIEYIAPGDFTKLNITSETIDLIHSITVLEHIPYQVIINILEKSIEYLRPGGYILNSIDLSDHNILSDPSLPPMDFLKYSRIYWEFFQNKLSYVNRLRAVHIKGLFKKIGFDIIKSETVLDPKNVKIVKKMKVDSQFQRLSPENLATQWINILAKKINK